MITELDVVNDMLAALGESPINSLLEDHPLVSSGTRMLRVANLREQTKQWWFNLEHVVLVPDPVTGYMVTPADTIRVTPTDTTLNYVQRGSRLYKAYGYGAEDRYVFTDSLPCWLVRLVPFADLPATAQVLISISAQVDFQKFYDADPLKLQQLSNEYRTALVTINAEHIRNAQVNLLRRPSTAATLLSLQPGGSIGPSMKIY